MKCPVCGIAVTDIPAQNGKLGCAHDYNVFRDLLITTIDTLQFDTRHVGKRPSRSDFLFRREQLTKRMNRAVKNEKYELAAEIKSELDTLQEA